MRAALATGGKLEVPTLEEQALYHNLCILGIVHPCLKQEGIELSRTAFRRSNNKALEYVLYRLYSIIEGKGRAQKDFKGMLPVLDKLQQAPFYQRIGDWMAELKKSGRIEPSVILPVSALKTNTSNRLILLLLELSTVALHQDAEATCQGISHAAYLPLPGSAGPGAGGIGSGLLDDPLVPPEMRLGVSTTRAKQACSEFLASAASASSICDAMEQRSLAFKKRYYELQAEIRQQHVAMAELPDGALVTTSSQGLMAGSIASMDATGVPDSSSQTSASSALTGPGASQHLPTRGSLHHGLPNPEKAGTLSSLLAALDEHLRVHKELSEALMTDSKDMDSRSGSCNAAVASRPCSSGFARDCSGIRFGQPSSQQVLHPYQIDGRALATEALVAAAAAVGSDAAARGGLGFEQQSQRRQQKNMLMPYGPDNIMKAFMSFASLLSSLAPHVTQLAMVGENAGPPPLLQPPSHPSGHAAHVAHQLQVHGSTSRQIAQLSRKVQEQAVACVPVLRALRLESSQAIAHRCDFTTNDCLDEDFLDMGPHLALPPALGKPARQGNEPFSSSMTSPKPQASAPQPSGPGATGTSSGAPSLVVMGSPCPSSAGTYMPTSGGASTSVLAPQSTVVATSTTAAPVDDGLAKIHARLRSLNINQPTTAAAAVSTGATITSTGGGLGAAAPLSATSARAASGAALANASMAMFSPPANLQDIGASPMAMSSIAGAARPPLSTTMQTYDLPMYAQAATASTISPLQSMSGQQQHQGISSSGKGLSMQLPTMGDTGRGSTGLTDSSTSRPWAQVPWLCIPAAGAAPGAPTAAAQVPTASQAGVAGLEWASSHAAAPGWMSSQQQQQPQQQQSLNVLPDPAPSSFRTLDPTFLQSQQQPQQQQRHLQRVASAGGLLAVPSADRSGGTGSSGGTSSSGATSASRRRHPPHADGLQPAETLAAEPGRAAADCRISAAAPQVVGCGASHGATALPSFGAEPVPFGMPGSNGRLASGESWKVDLGSLLDDDDDDKDGGHFLGSHRIDGRFTGGFSDAQLDTSVGKGFARSMGFSSLSPLQTPSMRAAVDCSTSHTGLLHTDTDADFGILAAEGELVSQALIFGRPVVAAVTSYSPHAVGATAEATNTSGQTATALFGAPLAEVSSGAWGSSGGGPAMDIGDNDRDRGGISATVSRHDAFGLMDLDSGDDVVMVDNNKDMSPGYGAKSPAPATGWLAAGLGTAPGGQGYKGTGFFDAFGALLSPQQPELQLQGPGHLQPHVPAAATTVQPAPTTMGGFGADILALKARMQAAMTKK